MNEQSKTTAEHARRIGDEIGVDWGVGSAPPHGLDRHLVDAAADPDRRAVLDCVVGDPQDRRAAGRQWRRRWRRHDPCALEPLPARATSALRAQIHDTTM